MANTRWDTNAYRKRIASLNRVELHQLYPSESWSLYRAIQESKTVLDLGCGNGAKSSVISKISSHVSYTGVDLADSVIQDARQLFPSADFISSDIFDFLQNYSNHYDVVMSWSVIKSIRRWKEFLSGMLDRADKYVLFDARFFDIEPSDPVFDVSLYSAEYGGQATPLMFSSYHSILAYLLDHPKVHEVQLCAYRSVPDPHSTYKGVEMPACYIFSFCVQVDLTERPAHKTARVYKQLPVELRENG